MNSFAALQHVSFGLLVLLLSAGLTRWIMDLNIRDVPNDRSSHEKETPKSGGIAIAVSFTLGIGILYLFADVVRLPEFQFLVFVLIVFALLVSSLIDDLYDISPLQKFVAQFIAAVLFASFVASIHKIWIPFVGTVELGAFGALLTVLWIVFFMNAFNFMDGINGIAAGAAMISGVFLGVISFFANAPFVYLSSVVLVCATGGFFYFNFPGGRIFMGDTGSQFLGFSFASLAVLASTDGFGGVSIFVVPILFLPFIFDVLYTLARRAWRGKNLSQAHREHLYQLLHQSGWTHAQVSQLYFAYFIACGVAALAIQASTPLMRVLLVGAVIIAMLGHALFVHQRMRSFTAAARSKGSDPIENQ